MSDLLAALPDLNAATVTPLYLRASVILVRPGNPAHIAGIADLLKPEHRILVVDGSGQQGLWEDVAGRLGDIRTVRMFRSNVGVGQHRHRRALAEPHAQRAEQTQVWGFGHPDFLIASATRGTAHLALYDAAIWDKYQIGKLAGDTFGARASPSASASLPAPAETTACRASWQRRRKARSGSSGRFRSRADAARARAAASGLATPLGRDCCRRQLWAGHDQEAAADAEEAREQADRDADAEQQGQTLRRALKGEVHVGVTLGIAPAQHEPAHADHHEAEQRQELLPVERLCGDRAQYGAKESSRPTRRWR